MSGRSSTGNPRCACGRNYEAAIRHEGRFPYEVLECPQCHHVVFTGEQVKGHREALVLHRLDQKEIGPLTLQRVGSSIRATVPKELVEMGFTAGEIFTWEIKSRGEIVLKLLRKDRPYPRRTKARGKAA